MDKNQFQEARRIYRERRGICLPLGDKAQGDAFFLIEHLDNTVDPLAERQRLAGRPGGAIGRMSGYPLRSSAAYFDAALAQRYGWESGNE